MKIGLFVYTNFVEIFVKSDPCRTVSGRVVGLVLVVLGLVLVVVGLVLVVVGLVLVVVGLVLVVLTHSRVQRP